MANEKKPLRTRLEKDIESKGVVYIRDYADLGNKQDISSTISHIRREFENKGKTIRSIKQGRMTVGYVTDGYDVVSVVNSRLQSNTKTAVNRPYMSALEARDFNISEIVKNNVNKRGLIRRDAFDCINNHCGINELLARMGFERHHNEAGCFLGWKKLSPENKKP
ncbi:hypothetical protein ENHY17A_50364 [Moraxellaceae bacterium 17A]|nr:hypothetical protein ENHY17A_50364 [Moraxellaceae bacterium 17A]